MSSPGLLHEWPRDGAAFPVRHVGSPRDGLQSLISTSFNPSESRECAVVHNAFLVPALGST